MVTAQLEALARAATHSGYQSTMTSNPRLVSHAIFEWWWVTKDNHGRYERRVRDAAVAARTTTTALNMDHVSMDAAAGHSTSVRNSWASAHLPRQSSTPSNNNHDLITHATMLTVPMPFLPRGSNSSWTLASR